MAYLKHQDLFKLAIAAAMQDRTTYLDAVRNDPDMAAEAKKEIATVRGFIGKTLEDALRLDKEGVFLVFVSAESWYQSLFDAMHGVEKKQAKSVHTALMKYRHSHLGRTQLEVESANTVGIPITEILANPDKYKLKTIKT